MMKPTKAVLEAVAARVLEDSAMVFAMPLTEPVEGFYSPVDSESAAPGTPPAPVAPLPLIGEDGPGDEEFWGVENPNAPESGPGVVSESDTERFGVQVAFNGHATGYCELWTTRECSKIIASNMLGVFDEGCETVNQTCLDALQETLNILCGNLLTEYAGSDPVFDLDPPAVVTRLVQLPVSDAAAEAWLEIDGQPALLRMYIDPDSLAA
jgi:Chemotaxis phosphatase CheX